MHHQLACGACRVHNTAHCRVSLIIETACNEPRRPLREALGHDQRWTIPLIHGFWQQRSLALFGRTLTLTLLARRSKHFAGTRFRKRGVNNSGHVANDVETEQMLAAGVDRKTGAWLLSSVVQVLLPSCS